MLIRSERVKCLCISLSAAMTMQNVVWFDKLTNSFDYAEVLTVNSCSRNEYE